jgi:hypothetical protein
MAIRELHSRLVIYAFCSPEDIVGIFDFYSRDFGYLPVAIMPRVL